MRRSAWFIRIALGASCVAWLAASPARAAFEDVEESPEARARGGAWVADRADDYAPFHNPASLAWAGRLAVAGSYLQPFGLPFSSLSTVCVTRALPGDLGGVGVGVREFGVSFLGEDLSRETTISLAHGFRLMHDRQSELAIGWRVEMFALSFGPSITGIDPGSARAFGVSVGGSAVLRDRTRIGFSVQNLNNPSIGDRDHEELRRRVAAGLAYEPYDGVQSTFGLTQELGEELQMRGGLSFDLADVATLRAGVRTNPNTLGAGLGLRWSGVSLDYALSTGGGALGETHHLGLGWHPSW